MVEEQPWDKETAEKYIHRLARSSEFELDYTAHAKKRIFERRIISFDVFYVLRNGFVLRPAEKSTREGLFKYRIERETPNSDGKILRLVIIPCLNPKIIKIVTAMWR